MGDTPFSSSFVRVKRLYSLENQVEFCVTKTLMTQKENKIRTLFIQLTAEKCIIALNEPLNTLTLQLNWFKN